MARTLLIDGIALSPNGDRAAMTARRADTADDLLDRIGPAVGIRRLLGKAVVALCGLAAAVALRAPAPALLLLVAVAAALAAGAPGAMRALLSQAVPPRSGASALAVDSTVVEPVVVAAPLLVAAAAAEPATYSRPCRTAQAIARCRCHLQRRSS